MAKVSGKQITFYLICLYLFLLIFDGALRKWFLTPLASVLLVSRVPVTLLIYMFAIQGGFFPTSGFVVGALGLAIITTPLGLLAHGDLFVAIYGLVTNYLSIPLIFIIPKVMDYYQVEKMGRYIVYLIIPMTVLIAMQFYSPQTAWVNRSVGGEEGIGFMGALGRYRPPGTFSFITGVAQFYTLAFAFLVAQFVNQRTLPYWLLVPTGAAFVMAVYGSISRLLAISVVIVILFCLAGLLINGRKLVKTFTIGLAVLAFFGVAAQFSYFQDGMETFSARWEEAKGEKEGVQEAIIDRTLSELTAPFSNISLDEPIGAGLGAGTNVGARLMVGQRAFLQGEGEWNRIINELGPLFGVAFIAYRIALTFYIGIYAFTTLKTGNILPWLLFGACFFLLLAGQWGQQTTLGFTILTAGLVLASGRINRKAPKEKAPPPSIPEPEEKGKHATAPMMS